MSKRPNILLLMTDQHRPDFTGFGGNSIVQTPNLDALAAQAMRFDRAYVATQFACRTDLRFSLAVCLRYMVRATTASPSIPVQGPFRAA